MSIKFGDKSTYKYLLGTLVFAHTIYFVNSFNFKENIMRQKFIIKNNPKSELNIKEYANLDREQKNNLLKSNQESFSLLYEETYEKELILSAIGKGKKNLISTIRTHNMYPIIIYAEKIADSVIELYNNNNTENNLSVELLFDDKEFLDSVKSEKIT
jgi:predicted transcriptional regulator